MRELLNFLMVFLQKYLPIKTILSLNISQAEDLALFSSIDTDITGCMVEGESAREPMPFQSQESAVTLPGRQAGSGDTSKLKESSYRPFCVANGSRKQVDKDDSVTLGLFSINTTSA